MTTKLSDVVPVTEAQILQLEAALSGSLPTLFRQFVLSHNGAQPDPAIFEVGHDNHSNVNRFIPIAQIQNIMNNHWYSFQKRIPIAWAEGGNYVLLDLDTGKIYFWDHELPDDEFELAADIYTFVNGLAPLDQTQIDASEGHGGQAWIDPDFVRELEKREPGIFKRNNSKK